MQVARAAGANARGKESVIAQKEDKVEMTGEIVEALRNGMFRIKLDNGHETLGYTAGKMRRFRIRMNPGDRVRIELSAYDLDRGRRLRDRGSRSWRSGRGARRTGAEDGCPPSGRCRP